MFIDSSGLQRSPACRTVALCPAAQPSNATPNDRTLSGAGAAQVIGRGRGPAGDVLPGGSARAEAVVTRPAACRRAANLEGDQGDARTSRDGRDQEADAENRAEGDRRLKIPA